MIDRKIIVQFFKFALVGALNTSIHFLVFLLLLRLVGMNYIVASVIGYCMGLLNSYFMNRHWTFQSRDFRMGPEFARFTLINVLALAVNTFSLGVFVGLWHLGPELGQVPAIGLSMGVNFLGNRYWAFRTIHLVEAKSNERVA